MWGCWNCASLGGRAASPIRGGHLNSVVARTVSLLPGGIAARSLLGGIVDKSRLCGMASRCRYFSALSPSSDCARRRRQHHMTAEPGRNRGTTKAISENSNVGACVDVEDHFFQIMRSEGWLSQSLRQCMVETIAAGVAVLKLLKPSQFDDCIFNHTRRIRSWWRSNTSLPTPYVPAATVFLFEFDVYTQHGPTSNSRGAISNPLRSGNLSQGSAGRPNWPR